MQKLFLEIKLFMFKNLVYEEKKLEKCYKPHCWKFMFISSRSFGIALICKNVVPIIFNLQEKIHRFLCKLGHY